MLPPWIEPSELGKNDFNLVHLIEYRFAPLVLGGFDPKWISDDNEVEEWYSKR